MRTLKLGIGSWYINLRIGNSATLSILYLFIQTFIFDFQIYQLPVFSIEYIQLQYFCQLFINSGASDMNNYAILYYTWAPNFVSGCRLLTAPVATVHFSGVAMRRGGALHMCSISFLSSSLPLQKGRKLI